MVQTRATVETKQVQQLFNNSFTVLTIWLALIPNSSSNSSPGPLRGTSFTAIIRTVTPFSSATAANTASPRPPSSKNKTMWSSVWCLFYLEFKKKKDGCDMGARTKGIFVSLKKQGRFFQVTCCHSTYHVGCLVSSMWWDNFVKNMGKITGREY